MTAEERAEREMHGLEMIREGIAQGLEFVPRSSLTARAFRALLPEVDYRLDELREKSEGLT